MGVAYSVGEVDLLYTVFVQWSPDIYTKDRKKKPRPRHLVREKGQNRHLVREKGQNRHLVREKGQNRYLVVEKDKVDVINKLLNNPDDSTPKNWKIVTVKDPKRRQSVCSSEESELEEQEEGEDLVPVLSGHSQLLDDNHLESLANHLPARTQGYSWHLIYSTADHGTSLKTLYRNMADLDSPVLLVIKDMHNKVFGAFSSHPFKVSDCCYGTGESFLYTFSPDFQAYKWSGENSYFVRGHMGSLQIGGGGGRFGLWLDADLYHGSSSSCPTFQNQTLSTQRDFKVQDLEVWTVQN